MNNEHGTETPKKRIQWMISIYYITSISISLLQSDMSVQLQWASNSVDQMHMSIKACTSMFEQTFEIKCLHFDGICVTPSTQLINVLYNLSILLELILHYLLLLYQLLIKPFSKYEWKYGQMPETKNTSESLFPHFSQPTKSILLLEMQSSKPIIRLNVSH